MDDEAENLRTQIRFLTDLIKNANKSDSKHERIIANQKQGTSKKATRYTAGRYLGSNKTFKGTQSAVEKTCQPGFSAAEPHNTSSFTDLQHSGKDVKKSSVPSKLFRKSAQPYLKPETKDGSSRLSTKYSWRKTNLVPKYSAINSNKYSTGMAQSKAKSVQSASEAPKTILKCQNVTSKDILVRKANKNSGISMTSTAVLINSQAISKHKDQLTHVLRKPEAVTGASVECAKSSTVPKQSKLVNNETLLAEKTKQMQLPQDIVKENKTVATSVLKVDEKLKTLSNSLKDELRKAEQQIHLLKQNLTEQKSLLTLKKNLTKPNELVAEKAQPPEQSSDLVQFKNLKKKQTDILQLKQKFPSHLKLPAKSIPNESKTTSPDHFISRSPYKLVKCNTSPTPVLATQKLNLDNCAKNDSQSNVIKTNYKLQVVKSEPTNKDQPYCKTDVNLKQHNLPEFKKTKYSLRRIQSAPAGKLKREKPPSKFVKVSKYSIKRVRRSLSNKSNEDMDSKSRQKLVNNSTSHSQLAARFIKSKYKINNKIVPQNLNVVHSHWQKKQYGTRSDKYSLNTKILNWRTQQLPFRRSGQFYSGPKMQWRHVSAHRYKHYGRLPYQHNYKVSRYLSSMYFTNTRRFDHKKEFRQMRADKFRLRRLNNLKRAVPFNPKLRTDHRQEKEGKQPGGNLIMINGVVFRSTQRQLVRAVHSDSSVRPKHRLLVKNTPAKQNFVTSPSSTVELGSVTYVQAKPGALVRQSSLKTRVVAARLMNKSVALATAKYKKDNTKSLKKKKYCMFYNRFGKCNRKEDCPFIHDPEKIAVCTRFLRGTCKVKNCPFSHKVSKEKMPVCSYFLRGKCTRDDCPYLHVNVNKDAEICEDFVSGYCSLGDQCKKKHTLVCPVFAQTGSCPNGNKCKLQHRKAKKRKRTQSGNSKPFRAERVNSDAVPSTSVHRGADTSPAVSSSLLTSWTSILPKSKDDTLVLDSSDEEMDDSRVPFKDRKLPTYISLSLKKSDTDVVTESDSETKKEEIPAMKIRPQL